MKKILVIDGNSIINRAFFGVRPLTTKSGKNTNAIFGMINIISRQMESIKPDYAAIAFDVKAPTFRHRMFTEYKAGRHPTPPELLEQFADAKECMEYMGIHVMELPGYEADDIQGTVAYMAHECPEEAESYILSGDRDLLQLIDDRITVLLAGNSETKAFKEAEFIEKYGIKPSQFVDMKALMGDSSDNIPGVRGIGEKTAASLIQKFSTLEGIYENIDDASITKGVRAKLIDGKDDAFLSRDLARIDTHAPIDKTLEELKYEGLQKGELYKKFTELELNSFIPKFRLSKEDVVAKECEKTSENCGNEEKNQVFPHTRVKITSIDANGIASITAKKIALIECDEGYNIFDGEYSYLYSGPISVLAPLFTKDSRIICYDGKSLIHRLREEGVTIPHGCLLLDLLLYSYVINPGSGDSRLSSLVSIFVSESVGDGDAFADLLFSLEEKMREKIESDGGIRILDELELPLLPILADIESVGFKIDENGMLEFADALDELSKELQERIYVQHQLSKTARRGALCKVRFTTQG